MTYKAEIIADSIAENGVRLPTVQATYPRIIHSEMMTHRQFSRNSASSRAIPIRRMIEMVQENPFIPDVFLQNKKGMQGGDPLEGEAADLARSEWHESAWEAAKTARRLESLGVHKQYANRILEPYLWHTVIITATDWSNFFAQRCHPDAQPEIRKIAEMIRDAMAASTPKQLSSRDWHLPYITDEDREWAAYKDPNRVLGESSEKALCEISIARCARVSYLSHSGIMNVEADIQLCNKLMENGHWSPFEHIATPLPEATSCGNFIGWQQFRKKLGK